MIISADLLDSKIFEIQENWTRQEDLWAANDTLKALPKGLQFFQTISPAELPKVMGLEGIHHPDALPHFARVTFCPWYRRARTKGPSSTTCRQCIIDYDWCVRNVSALTPPLWRPCGTMAEAANSPRDWTEKKTMAWPTHPNQINQPIFLSCIAHQTGGSTPCSCMTALQNIPFLILHSFSSSLFYFTVK